MDIFSIVALFWITLIFWPNFTISMPGKWFLSAKSPAALLYPLLLSYKLSIFKVSLLKVSIWMLSFNFWCKTSNVNFCSLYGNSSNLIFLPSNIRRESSNVSTSIVAVSFLLYAFDLYKYGLWIPLFTVSFIVLSFCISSV